MNTKPIYIPGTLPDKIDLSPEGTATRNHYPLAMNWSNESLKQNYATVDEIIVMLQRISHSGKGHYLVTCNGEYMLARKDEVPDVCDEEKSVDLGGYG